MSTLPYHKRYHGDALTGFMPLTLEERGAYQTLLDMMYDRGGPLIDNERLIAGYMNCSVRKWRQVREQLIDKRKIYITSDGLIANSRARKEIENQSKTHRKLIESGSKGGRTRAQKEKNANENNEGDQATLEQGLKQPLKHTRATPETRSHSVDKSTADERLQIDPIKEIFDLGVLILTQAGIDEQKARSNLGKWKKDRGEVEVMKALLECQREHISEPLEWLTKRLQRARFVSKSGYEYRGSLEAIERECIHRNDNDTLWSVKAAIEAQNKKSASG